MDIIILHTAPVLWFSIVYYCTFVIKVATMKSADNFHYEGKPSCATIKLTCFIVKKMN